MRRSWIAFTAVFAVCGSSHALAKPRSVRSVQLIAMGEGKPPEPARPSSEATGRANEKAREVVARFSVHDLSRRWVARQMTEDFGAMAPTPTPELNGGQVQPAADFVHLPRASTIAVPMWMRGFPLSVPQAMRTDLGCAAPSYRPAGFLRADAEMRRASYYGLMTAIACEHGLPVGLFDAMIIQESRYHPGALSPKRAFGLTQLMPGTAVALGVNRYDIEGNLRGGAKYLRQQLDQFGQYHLALAAYNAGPGRVRGGLVPRIAETQAYVQGVLGNWSRLSGLAPPSIEGPIPNRRTAAVSTF